MASITSTGLGSGIDIDSLVSQLVSAEKQPATQRLDSREATLQTQISAFGTFKSTLSTFQSAISSLKSAATLQGSKTATVANDKLFTASAVSTAPVGSYGIQVQELAQSQRLATAADHRFSSTTDVVGTGVLTFQLGTYGTPDSEGKVTFTVNPDKEVGTVTIDSSNNTLLGVRDAINKANIGVQASIVNDGGGYRLVLGSTATGAANSLKITVADDDSGNTDTAGLSLLAHDPTLADNTAGKNMIQTLAGKDAQVVIDGLTVTSASNTLSEAIPGVTLNLKAKDSTATTLTVGQDNSAISTSVQSFVKAYNDLASTVKSLTSYNAETKQSGPLLGDFSVRSIFNQLRGELNKAVAGASSQFGSLAELGLSTQNDGTLKLDSTKLQKAIEADPQGVAGLFARTGRTNDSLVNYVGATSDSQAGDYALTVSRLATQGNYTGANVGADSFAIDGTNNTFSLKVDGTQSGTITLSQNDAYTSTQLIAELQSKINGDSALKTAGVSVSVSFSAGQFILTSASYGASSKIEFTAANATLGFSTGITSANVDGQDAQGTIGGIEATGSGRKLTGSSGGAVGISVEVLGGTIGDRGKVSLSDGLAQRLDSLLGDVLDGDGSLSTRTDSLNKQVAKLNDQREALDTKMSALEARYRAQFTAMDKLVGQLKATSTYLTQQFSSSSNNN